MKSIYEHVFPLHCALPGQVLPFVSLSDLVLCEGLLGSSAFYHVFNHQKNVFPTL